MAQKNELQNVNDKYVKKVLDDITSKDIKKGRFVVPPTIKKIGFLACYQVENLKYLDLGNVEFIGNQAFANCMNLETIKWSQNLKIIGELSFAKTNIKTIILPSSVQSIGDKCFSFSAVVEAYINNALCEQNAFEGCKFLTKVYSNNCQSFRISSEKDGCKVVIQAENIENMQNL